MRSWDAAMGGGNKAYKPPDARLTTPGSLYIRKILSHVATETETEEYVQKLRVSSLPICGLIDAVNRLEKPEKKIPFSMDFYTSVGTAVHETYQQRMMRSKRYGKMVFGNFLCRKEAGGCGHLLRLQRRPESLICPKCNTSRLFYDEISFDLHGVSGHLDMLTLDRHGQFVAWEFKTTGEKNVANPQYLPYLKHHMQIQTYCMMLKMLYNIKVKMYTICYISRNKAKNMDDENPEDQIVPFAFKFDSYAMTLREDETLKIQAQDKAIKRLFASPSRTNLKRLENLRPCKSKKDYNNKDTGMTHAFFGKNKCPYLSKGLCFHTNPKITEAGLKLASLLGID